MISALPLRSLENSVLTRLQPPVSQLSGASPSWSWGGTLTTKGEKLVGNGDETE